MTSRSALLFSDIPPDAPPPERLKDGQPARGWKRAAPGSALWVFDCSDGSRAMTGGGTTRVRFFGGKA